MQHMMRNLLLASATVLLVGGGAQAQQGPQAPNVSFFVTSAPIGKGGDLGGLAGADAHCQQLAATVGAGGKTWHALLSVAGTNARDRIGNGPWQNSKGTVIATSVDDLFSANNKLGAENSLTERGNRIAGFGFTPNWHDALTGSTADGRAAELTCNNWTSNDSSAKTMLGHIDKRGGADTEAQRSWDSAHPSRGCTQPDFVATGGNGLFYCFAQ
jgi:hypothetical protein